MRTIGHYQMLRELGRGGMATVYLARQPGLGRLAALKELGALRAQDAALVTRFVREARMAGALNHPNIVTVYDYFDDAGTPYIAMEYVEGGSLRPQLGQGTLTLEQIGGVLMGLLAGLDAAARLGVVHRDLKPENVLVTAEGTVKIADFGIGKAGEDLMLTAASLTMTGATMGTPAYMAPEQARGHAVTPRTDLYALGIIAYEMLVGQTPFADTDTPMGVLLRQVNDPIPDITTVQPGVDAAMAAWVGRLVEKDPDRRPRSAAHAADELDEILARAAGPRWRRASALPVDDAAAVVAALAAAPAAAEAVEALEAPAGAGPYVTAGFATAPEPMPTARAEATTAPMGARADAATVAPRMPLPGAAAAGLGAGAVAGAAGAAAAGAPISRPRGGSWRRAALLAFALVGVAAALAGVVKGGAGGGTSPPTGSVRTPATPASSGAAAGGTRPAAAQDGGASTANPAASGGSAGAAPAAGGGTGGGGSGTAAKGTAAQGAGSTAGGAASGAAGSPAAVDGGGSGSSSGGNAGNASGSGSSGSAPTVAPSAPRGENADDGGDDGGTSGGGSGENADDGGDGP